MNWIEMNVIWCSFSTSWHDILRRFFNATNVALAEKLDACIQVICHLWTILLRQHIALSIVVKIVTRNFNCFWVYIEYTEQTYSVLLRRAPSLLLTTYLHCWFTIADLPLMFVCMGLTFAARFTGRDTIFVILEANKFVPHEKLDKITMAG